MRRADSSPRARVLERVAAVLSALLCLLFTAGLRDVPPGMVRPMASAAASTRDAILKVTVTQNSAAARGVSVRAFNVEGERVELAGQGETDANGVAMLSHLPHIEVIARMRSLIGSGSGATIATAPTLKAEAGADVVIETGQPIAFSGLASQGAKTYKWYLGDGSVKDGAELVYTYQFPGTYLVTLEVGNGADTNIDQSRVFVFGGKVLINEFFIGAASTTASNAAGGWLELYNPNNFSADISGWILDTGETKFSAPNFVLIPAKGFLVLSQNITGLDLSKSGKIQLKYPNGFTVDVVSFDKNKPEASANRSADGFFWSKELTPGRPNVIVSSSPNIGLNSTILPQTVLSKPQENPRVLATTAYNIVAELPADASNGENFYGNNPAISAQLPFWQKISKSIFFWIFSTALLGAMISWGYITMFRKK